MTPSRRAAETANKRAERLRRKEAGEVRVEVWIRQDLLDCLDWYCKATDQTRSGIIDAAIAGYLE